MVGSLLAMNSNGAVVTNLADDDEMAAIEAHIPCMRLDDQLNAAGNNILVNDHGAIVSPEYSEATARAIGEALGVEAVRSSIGECIRTTVNHGVRSVGAGIIANSKGAVVGDQTTPIEMGKIEDALVLY